MSGLVERFGMWLVRLIVSKLPRFAKVLEQVLCEQRVSQIREHAITFMLECLRHELVALNAHLALPDLRANLMLLQPNGNLRMVYTSGDYSLAEKQLEWREGIGCCGMAWARKEPTVTDIEDTERLPPPYKEVVQHVQSVLSVPLRRRTTGEWIGVLNVDALKPLEQSCLGEPEMRDAVIRYALGIELLL